MKSSVFFKAILRWCTTKHFLNGVLYLCNTMLLLKEINVGLHGLPKIFRSPSPKSKSKIGKSIKSKSGSPSPKPWIKIQLRSQDQEIKISQHLGKVLNWIKWCNHSKFRSIFKITICLRFLIILFILFGVL